MIVQCKNPFTEAGFDVQRSDLWVLDMSTVLRHCVSLPATTLAMFGVRADDLPSAPEIFAAAVSLPVQKLKLVTTLQGAVPCNFPGTHEPLDSVQVTFNQDAGNGVSKIMALLTVWRALSRIGKRSSAGGPAIPLPSAASKPDFEFDVDVRYLKGTESSATLAPSSTVTLSRCWLKTLQPGPMDTSGTAGQHTIVAQLQAGQILTPIAGISLAAMGRVLQASRAS